MKWIKNNLANFLTIINLVCGVVSLYFTSMEQFSLAVYFILLGGLADMFDGKVARMTKTTSELGKYLDSNSDLVTFGVAPSAIIYYSSLNNLDWYGAIPVIFFIICASYRLAKYNLASVKGFFIGIPTTFAGPLLALSYFLEDYLSAVVMACITLLLGGLMISKIKVRKAWF